MQMLPFPILVPSVGRLLSLLLCFLLLLERLLLSFFSSKYFSLSPLETNARVCSTPASYTTTPKCYSWLDDAAQYPVEAGLQWGLTSYSLSRLQSALYQTRSWDFRHVEYWAKAWGFGMDCLPPVVVEVFKNSKMKQDTPFMWLQSFLSESWIHGLDELCVQGGTPETCGDVLTPSCNQKVNRACAKSVKQPGMVCSSLRVALNPHLQPEWMYSPSHTLERDYIGLSWGPAGFDWWVMPRMPWGRFLRHTCETEVGIQIPSEEGEK